MKRNILITVGILSGAAILYFLWPTLWPKKKDPVFEDDGHGGDHDVGGRHTHGAERVRDPHVRVHGAAPLGAERLERVPGGQPTPCGVLEIAQV